MLRRYFVCFEDSNLVLPESHLFADLPGEFKSQTRLQILSVGPWLVHFPEPVPTSVKQRSWKPRVLRGTRKRTRASAGQALGSVHGVSVSCKQRPSYTVSLGERTVCLACGGAAHGDGCTLPTKAQTPSKLFPLFHEI